MSMDDVSFEHTLQLQAEEFALRLRNPLERGVKVLSDVLQGGLKALGRLMPELGWTPPEDWDKDLQTSATGTWWR